jgi:hypothetical protein
MTVASVERPRAVDSFVVAAAWCLVAAGVLPLALPVAVHDAARASSPWHSLFVGMTVLIHLLVLAGIAGLARSGALGRGLLGLAGTVLAVAAFFILAVAEPTNEINTKVAGVLYGLGSLGVIVGLILVGAATIRTALWTSWRRFTPLACGLFFVIAVMPSFALPGSPFHYVLGLWGLTFLLLGIAVLAESPSPS